jgi:hypothetical protein
MDSSIEPQADPKPDAAAADARESVAAIDSKDAAASISASADAHDKKPDAEKPKENAGPKVPPVPSSALVILPSSMRRFDAKDTADERPNAGRAKWLRYGSRAAIALILFGGAFAAGGHFLGSNPPALHAAADPAAVSWQVAKDNTDSAEIRRTTKALGDEIHALETRFDSLRVAVQTQTPDEVRGLKKSIESLKASLDAEKAEANASIAQLSAKLDRVQREEPKVTQASFDKSERAENKPKLEQAADPKAIQATLDRAARAEKTAPMMTASIPATPAAQSARATTTQVPATSPRAQPLPMASAEPQRKPPQLLTNWVVRDVYDGIALVEGPEGAIEVTPGDTIPGAGTVRAIERRGGGWIVVTSRGLVDYERD